MCRLSQILRTAKLTLPSVRYREHIRSIKHKREDSFKKYTPIWENRIHQKWIDYFRKGRAVNKIENFYIYVYKHNPTLIDSQKLTEKIITVYHSSWSYNTRTKPCRTTQMRVHKDTHTPTLPWAPWDISSAINMAHTTTTTSQSEPHTGPIQCRYGKLLIISI